MKHRLLTAALGLGLLLGCDPEDPPKGATSAESLLEQGRLQLSRNEADEAFETFSLLAENEAYACEADYGLFLASIQRAVGRVSTIVEAAGTFLGGSPLLPQAQSFNAVIEGVVRPFEEHFREIRDFGLLVVEGGCTLYLPEGFPVIVGKSGNLLYAEAVMGDEWDSAAARVIISGIDGMQAALNFVLAHELTFDEDLEYLIEVVTEEVDAVQDYEQDLAAGVTDAERRTWIGPIRAAGVFFDLNPKLLAFGNETRFAEVDDNLEELFRMLYSSDDAGVSGVIPDMLARNRDESAEELRDNVLAWIDNGDGIAGGDDTLRIGLRKFDIASTVAMPNNPGGFEITLNSLFGDVERAVAEVHGIIDTLGDQLEAAETGAEAPRFSLESVNAVLNAISFTRDVEPIPAAVELDIGAYFVDPVPLRQVVPYWYDDGISLTKVFLVEGEAQVTSPAEPYVVTGDTSHFPASFPFGAVGEVSPRSVTDAEISPDGLEAIMTTLDVPLPYIAWQDPTFHGVLWVNPRALPVEPEGADAFVQPNQRLTNKAVLSYLLHYTQPIEVPEVPVP